MRAPWLGDVLRDAGLEVVTVDNPIGRGRDMRTIYGVVGHDTVTTRSWSDARVDALLRDGRSDLPGPLSQLGLDRAGRFRWIADGRCNHNGHGTWGNDAIGIEVYCAGGLEDREEPWNGTQREAFVIGARAILEHLDLGPSDYWNPRAAGHKETDEDRKIDPYQVDMDAVRRQICEDDMQEVPQPRWVPDQVLDDLVRWGVDDEKPTREPLVIWRMLVFQHRTIKAVQAMIADAGDGRTMDEIAQDLARRLRNG